MNTDSEDASLLVPVSGQGGELSGYGVPEASPSRQDEAENVDPTGMRAHVVFLDHTGDRFLFPFERCQEWSAFKSLIGEVYTHAVADFRSEISKDRFDILTSTDEHILPTTWGYVIGTLPLYKRGHNSYTIKIKFWMTMDSEITRRAPGTGHFVYVSSNKEHSESANSRSHSRSRSHSPILERFPDDDDDEAEPEDSDEDSVTLTEDEDEADPVTIIPPPRTIVTPIDREGNPLSFLVDTKWAIQSHQNLNTNQGSKGEEPSNPRSIRNMETENFKILKAVSVTSESRTTIELHAFPGPESSSIADDIDVRWYHLHGDQLDFAQFKNACLNIQGLPERLRRLIIKTMSKIEKEKLKPFQDGLFIEPGTVIRGDEKQQTDPYSVIFSCIPYFAVNSPFKPSSGKSDRLHPPRSLMQSYYPYEPVQERDEEQAFTKFANSPSKKIIQVPSLWLMNIGTHAVVTCGYQPLSSDFVKSITVVQEDLKALKLEEGNALLNIRLIDWEGRALLYSPAECRSYFEMEQKLRELKLCASSGPATAILELAWNTHEGKKKVTPGNWLEIFKPRTNIVVNLSIMSEQEAREMEEKLGSENIQQPRRTKPSPRSIPPFFCWPFPTRTDPKLGGTAVMAMWKPDTPLKTAQEMPEQDALVSSETRRCMHCLEHIEKAMLTETIYEYDAQHVVDKTFTSTKYYQSLPENTYEDVRSNLKSLIQSASKSGVGSSSRTMHQMITDVQCTQIITKTSGLVETVHATVKLFVSEVDTNTMLRKVWGALKAMGTIIGQVDKRCSRKADPNEYMDPEWKAPKTANRKWTVRPATTKTELGFISPADPAVDQELIRSVKKCQSCRHHKVYTNPQDALEHMRKHLILNTATKPQDLGKWIRNDEERLVEDINAAYLVILNQASDAVQSLFLETRQLAEGVQVEEGKMSELYTLPYELQKTLRRLMVFYFAIERAFHYTELSYEKGDEVIEDEDAPFSNMGLEVLSRFCESAKASVKIARVELCAMAASSVAEDLSKRLSLGPQYVSSWFMRRLLVKPLNDSMTVADIYREYLSTLQFQVNHRPGKRLLRSINLLQEELAALEQVNTWQTKLIESYTRVLDDATYPTEIPSRRSFFRYERLLLESCIDILGDTRDDYRELIRRCGPLSESTKQSAEINEEDHGKAIFVFTVVTVIFMPLSFVTSYLGMNTADIRDMENKQSLFWTIALPLTAVTMGSILYMAYYSDELRDSSSSVYRRLIGKQDTSRSARGISVAQRKRGLKSPLDSSSTVDYKSLADEAEFATPQHFGFGQRIDYGKRAEYLDTLDQAIATTAYEYPQPRTTILQEAQSGGKLRMATQATTYSMPARLPSPEYGNTRSYGLRPPPPPPPPPMRMHMPRPPPPGPSYDDRRPTYMRVARKHVDVDTLQSFGIPWEIDSTNPDYYLLLRYMDETETDMLFEHTRRLRGLNTRRDGPKDYTQYQAVDDWWEPDKEKPRTYEWVRKSKRTQTHGRGTGYAKRERTTSYHW